MLLSFEGIGDQILESNYQRALRRVYTLLTRLESSQTPLTSQEIFLDSERAGEGLLLEDIRYDLNLLQTMGFPLIHEQNAVTPNEPRWSYLYRVPFGLNRTLSVLETFALFLIRKSLNPAGSNEFSEALNGLLRVIHGTSPDERLIPLRDLDEPKHRKDLDFLSDPFTSLLDSDSLSTLRAAELLSQSIGLTYASKLDGASKEVILNVHSFYFLKGVYYLVLRSDEQCRTKAVPIQQIQSVHLTRDFSVSADFRESNESRDVKTTTTVYFP